MAPQAGEEVTGTVDAELWKTSRISRNIHCRAQQSKHIVGWCVRKDAIRRKQDLLKPEHREPPNGCYSSLSLPSQHADWLLYRAVRNSREHDIISLS